MKYCFHYQFDKDDNKYKSLAIRYIGLRNPNRVYRHKCKRCGLPLHNIDIINLNNKINDLNRKLSGEDNYPFMSNSDIHDMLAPVPDAYNEDSKYRDNQIR